MLGDDELFRLMLDAVDDAAICMLDKHGRVLTWSSGAQRIKGYEAQAVVGRSFEMFYPPLDIISGVPTEELEIAEEDGTFEEDGQLTGFTRVTHDLTRRPPQRGSGRDSTEASAHSAAPLERVPLATLSVYALKPVLDGHE